MPSEQACREVCGDGAVCDSDCRASASGTLHTAVRTRVGGTCTISPVHHRPGLYSRKLQSAGCALPAAAAAAAVSRLLSSRYLN